MIFKDNNRNLRLMDAATDDHTLLKALAEAAMKFLTFHIKINPSMATVDKPCLA